MNDCFAIRLGRWIIDDIDWSVIDDRYYLPKLTMGVRMELAMMKIWVRRSVLSTKNETYTNAKKPQKREWAKKILAPHANPTSILKPKNKVLFGKTPFFMFKTVFDNEL